MPITRTLTPCKTGRVKFATSPAPHLPLADLVSNPTPPGQIAREPASWVGVRIGPRFWPARLLMIFWMYFSLLIHAPGTQTFGLTVADSVTPKDCAPPRVPDSGEFRPASHRFVAQSTTTLHPPLIRFPAALFRSRNSPETGPDLTPARRQNSLSSNPSQCVILPDALPGGRQNNT